ncbi:DMT family transporter [Neisseria yangbaofengii]|uniref:DMT family transporter n=1 Tax=Neisseria yangbaofengii TaxID=2709396 RepID=UPI0013ECF8A7|nr:DMT family transporter [Neisseria yangbaofengii]
MWAVYLGLAFAAGMASAMQAAINTQLARAMGDETLIATLISFAVGTVALFFITWVKTDLFGYLAAIGQQSWWKLSGGLLGAMFVFTSVLLAPKLGIANMLFVIIIGQLLAAAVIDHYGFIGMAVREMTMPKLIGLVVMGIGLALFSFGDKVWKQ